MWISNNCVVEGFFCMHVKKFIISVNKLEFVFVASNRDHIKPFDPIGTYFQKGYTSMWLINASNSIDSVSMLEAALISEFGKHVGCHNKPNSGGEGGLNKKSPPTPTLLCLHSWGACRPKPKSGIKGSVRYFAFIAGVLKCPRKRTIL